MKRYIRNRYQRAMMDRHHGNQVHKNRRKKRIKNPKRNWRAEWE